MGGLKAQTGRPTEWMQAARLAYLRPFQSSVLYASSVRFNVAHNHIRPRTQTLKPIKPLGAIANRITGHRKRRPNDRRSSAGEAHAKCFSQHIAARAPVTGYPSLLIRRGRYSGGAERNKNRQRNNVVTTEIPLKIYGSTSTFSSMLNR